MPNSFNKIADAFKSFSSPGNIQDQAEHKEFNNLSLGRSRVANALDDLADAQLTNFKRKQLEEFSNLNPQETLSFEAPRSAIGSLPFVPNADQFSKGFQGLRNQDIQNRALEEIETNPTLASRKLQAIGLPGIKSFQGTQHGPLNVATGELTNDGLLNSNILAAQNLGDKRGAETRKINAEIEQIPLIAESDIGLNNARIENENASAAEKALQGLKIRAETEQVAPLAQSQISLRNAKADTEGVRSEKLSADTIKINEAAKSIIAKRGPEVQKILSQVQLNRQGRAVTGTARINAINQIAKLFENSVEAVDMSPQQIFSESEKIVDTSVLNNPVSFQQTEASNALSGLTLPQNNFGEGLESIDPSTVPVSFGGQNSEVEPSALPEFQEFISGGRLDAPNDQGSPEKIATLLSGFTVDEIIRSKSGILGVYSGESRARVESLIDSIIKSKS